MAGHGGLEWLDPPIQKVTRDETTLTIIIVRDMKSK